MGNTIMKWVPGFIPEPSDVIIDYHANEEKIQTDEKLKNDHLDDQALSNCKDKDLVGIVQLLERNLEKDDADLKDLKLKLLDVLNKHQTTQCHPVFEALQFALQTQGQYSDMMKAIDGLVKDRKLAIIKRTKNNHASQEKHFHANIDAMSDLVKSVLTAAGAGPVGPILVALLQCVKKVDFFTSRCRTEGHKDETIGIIDIIWDDEDSGTVLFEIAKIEVKMVDENGEVLFIGGSKVFVSIDIYFAKASMELESFMTPQQLKKLKANTKGFKLEG